MAEEGNVNIMSVELAIKREVAYRKKLSRLYPEDDGINELLPLEMPCSSIMSRSFPSSSQMSGPNSISFPNNQSFLSNPFQNRPSAPRTQGAKPCSTSDDASRPVSTSIACCLEPFPVQSQNPTPCLWPNQDMTKASIYSVSVEKRTTNSFQFLPNQWTQPCYISNNTSLFCKVCQVNCSGPVSFKQHMRGQRHKAMLEIQQPSRNAGGINKRNGLRCTLCNIWCSSEDAFQLHLNGQNHKAKLRDIEVNKKGKVPLQLWCELCQVACSHEDTYMLHLKGKKHEAKLQDMEKKRRTM